MQDLNSFNDFLMHGNDYKVTMIYLNYSTEIKHFVPSGMGHCVVMNGHISYYSLIITDLFTNFMHTILTKVIPDNLKACLRFV